jgi:hypothetical protein
MGVWCQRCYVVASVWMPRHQPGWIVLEGHRRPPLGLLSYENLVVGVKVAIPVDAPPFRLVKVLDVADKFVPQSKMDHLDLELLDRNFRALSQGKFHLLFIPRKPLHERSIVDEASFHVFQHPLGLVSHQFCLNKTVISSIPHEAMSQMSGTVRVLKEWVLYRLRCCCHVARNFCARETKCDVLRRPLYMFKRGHPLGVTFFARAKSPATSPSWKLHLGGMAGPRHHAGWKTLTIIRLSSR